MNLNFDSVLIAPVLISIVMIVVLSEAIKKLDTKNWLNGAYKVYLPVIFSVMFSFILFKANFILKEQAIFFGFVMFSTSTFFYNAILKTLRKKKSKLLEEKENKDV